MCTGRIPTDMVFNNMEVFHVIPSGLNRFSVSRFKPAEQDRFKPVFCFENITFLTGFRFLVYPVGAHL